MGDAINNDEFAQQESGKKVEKEIVKKESIDDSAIKSVQGLDAAEDAIKFPEKTEADFADSMPNLPRCPGQLFGNSWLSFQEQPKPHGNTSKDDKSAGKPKSEDDAKAEVKSVLRDKQAVLSFKMCQTSLKKTLRW